MLNIVEERHLQLRTRRRVKRGESGATLRGRGSAAAECSACRRGGPDYIMHKQSLTTSHEESSVDLVYLKPPEPMASPFPEHVKVEHRLKSVHLLPSHELEMSATLTLASSDSSISGQNKQMCALNSERINTGRCQDPFHYETWTRNTPTVQLSTQSSSRHRTEGHEWTWTLRDSRSAEMNRKTGAFCVK